MNQPNIDQETAELLETPIVHASSCQVSECSYHNCGKIKQLFEHSTECEMDIFGRCKICQSLWFRITCHATSCSDSNCAVPKCQERKEGLKRFATGSGSGMAADSSGSCQNVKQSVESESSRIKSLAILLQKLVMDSGLCSCSRQTARHLKMKQQVESEPSKNQGLRKLLEELTGAASG